MSLLFIFIYIYTRFCNHIKMIMMMIDIVATIYVDIAREYNDMNDE